MGIIKHGQVFWLDIRIKGKRYRRSLHTTNKLEALHLYGQKREELIQEKTGKRTRFSEFAKKYLDWAWSSKPASADREQQRLKRIAQFFESLGIIYLEDITPYHAEQLKALLREKNLSKSTINMYLQILRGMFYRAIDWEVYSKPNPMKKVKFFRKDSHVQILSKEEMAKVIQAAKEISERPDPRSSLQKCIHDLILFALNTGMRKSEILGLKWKDIREGEAIIKGKGEKTRAVPLNRTVQEILSRQPRRDDYVFRIENRYQPAVLWRTIGQIKKRTGIDFHFHLTRHAFASALLEKGVDFVTISEILGHSRMSMTLIYSHTDKDKKKRAVEILEK